MLDNEKESMKKIIPSNYPRIQHIHGSKMIDAEDRLLNRREQDWLTVKTRTKTDIVIVTEKVDGCNVGVLRFGRKLIPILRKGYDVRTNSNEWIRAFYNFVQERRSRFLRLLNDGERVCGEWMIKTHTIRYRMRHEPFITFDLISDTHRDRYLNAKHRLEANGFTTAGLVHYGTAIPVGVALNMLGEGFHGAEVGPEGIVYRYEGDGGWLFNGKYVANPNVGNNELFRSNMDTRLMNKWR